MRQNWTGVLIEADPRLFRQLQEESMDSQCMSVSLQKIVRNMTFLGPKDSLLDHPKNYWDPAVGKLKMRFDLNLNPPSTYQDIGQVTCFPLQSILKALDLTHIHLFSLDIEGAELKVLKTLTWDGSLQTDVILVEHVNCPEGGAAMDAFLTLKGYIRIFKSAHDFIFRHSSLLSNP